MTITHGAEAFPYQKTFDAIAAATSVSGGHIAISVTKFVEAFGAAPSVEQDERGACVVSDNCKWPACRRDCVFDSRAQHVRAASTSADVVVPEEDLLALHDAEWKKFQANESGVPPFRVQFARGYR
jgi:hypothetical protein